MPQPTRITERTLTDRAGNVVRVIVEIDEGAKLEAEIVRLANKAHGSKTQKCASSGGGVIRVCVRAPK